MATVEEQIEQLQVAVDAGRISVDDPRLSRFINSGLISPPSKKKDQETTALKAFTGALIRSATFGFVDPLEGKKVSGGAKVAEILGEVAGFAVPLGAAGKAIRVGRGVLKLAGPATKVGKSAQRVGTLSLAEAGVEATTPKERERPLISELISGEKIEGLKRIPVRALEGAAFGTVLEALGPAVSAIFRKAPTKDISSGAAAVSGSFRSIQNQISRFGEPGKELVKKVQRVEEISAQRIGKAEGIISRELGKLNPNELENFVDVASRGVRPINETVQKAYSKIKPLFKEVAKEAEEKIPGFRPREKFFPQFQTKEFLEKLRDKDFLNIQAAKLVEKGKFSTIEEAELAIKEMVRFSLRGRKFGSLDFPRELDLPGWIKDPKEVLPRYFRAAYKRLAEIDEFGLADKEVRGLIKQIGIKIGPNAEKVARDSMKAIVKDYDYNRTLLEAAQGVRTFSIVTRLGLAQITNLGQTANTLIRTNILSTFKGIQKSFTKEGKEFAESAGVLVNSIAEELAGASTVAEKFLKFIGFQGVERFNRISSANAGREYVKQQFSKLIKNNNRKFSRRKLSEVGIDPDQALKRGHLTSDELKRAAFRVNKSAQFTTQPQDLPLFWSDPMGKVLTQFKTFAFQHAKLMNDAIVKELVRGNPGPLFRGALAAATIGELVVDAKHLARFQNPLEKRSDKGFLTYQRQMENFFQLGAFGLFTDMLQSAQFGKGQVTAFFSGPTLSTIAEFAAPPARELGKLIEEGEVPDIKRAGRQIAKSATRLFPN